MTNGAQEHPEMDSEQVHVAVTPSPRHVLSSHAGYTRDLKLFDAKIIGILTGCPVGQEPDCCVPVTEVKSLDGKTIVFAILT